MGRRVRLRSRVTKIVPVPVAVADDGVDAGVVRKPKSQPMATQNRVTRTTTTKTCLVSEAMTILSLRRRRPLTRAPSVLMMMMTTRTMRTVKSVAHVAVVVAVASVRMTNPHRSLRL